MSVQMTSTAYSSAATYSGRREQILRADTESRTPSKGEESFVRPQKYREIRAGFGENTQSPATAAFDTLDVSVREVKRMVPTLEEIRKSQQVRRENPSVAPTPAEQSRGTVGEAPAVEPRGETAGVAPATPVASAASASQVSSQYPVYTDPASTPNSPTPAPRQLDVRV